MTFMNLVAFARSLMRTRTELAAENLALRQQLAALHRQSKRPRCAQEYKRAQSSEIRNGS